MKNVLNYVKEKRGLNNGNNYCFALGNMRDIVWCNCNQLEIIMEAKLIAMNLTVIIISVILTLYVTL